MFCYLLSTGKHIHSCNTGKAMTCCISFSQDCSVSKLTGYRMDDWTSIPTRSKNFSLHRYASPPSITERVTPAKKLDHEADHSPPPSSKVKNVWSLTSTPQRLHAWCFSTQTTMHLLLFSVHCLPGGIWNRRSCRRLRLLQPLLVI